MKAKLIQTPEEWQLLVQDTPIIRSKKLCTLLKIYNKYMLTLEEKILQFIGSKEVMKRDVEKNILDIRDFEKCWDTLKKEGIIEYNFKTHKWSVR